MWPNVEFRMQLPKKEPGPSKIIPPTDHTWLGIRKRPPNKGYIYSRVRRNVKSQFLPNRVFWRLDLAIGLSREFKPRANGLASLGLAGPTLQLLACLARVQHSGGLQAASHPRDPATSPCFFAQSWAILHTLLHTTLTWFPPKYRLTNC